MSHRTKIGLEFGKLGPVLEWCERNCASTWNVDFGSEQYDNGNSYTFSFDSEKDYINFLIWKQ
jgi:hypothetical protein